MTVRAPEHPNRAAVDPLRRWRRRWAAAVLIAASIGAASCSHPSNGSFTPASAASGATYDYVIPAGTNEAAHHGAKVDIIPSPFVMKVGEVVRIRNDDDVAYYVGPFYVGAHQTMTQAATAPGEFRGLCALHSGSELLVRIVR